MLIIILFLTILLLFFIINIYFKKEYFNNHCNNNVMCNGNKINALCIEQSCKPCGLQAKCSKNEDCGPNLCINGCCDNL